MTRNPLAVLTIIMITLVSGCNEDERLARMAQDATERQAEQNKAMAEVSRDSVQASGRLVEAEGEARQELLAMQRELHDQQAEIARNTAERNAAAADLAAIRATRTWRLHQAAERILMRLRIVR